ncbi:hypothetical protein [Thalassobellus citreus]|uniref:hypothetical protein n=1 Tax=Thalassobellus citreus TaxID=3367752 RepID=UPI0037A5B565
MKENKENEPKKNEESIDFKPLVDLIKTSLKDLKINEIIESSNKVKIEKINAEKTFNSRDLTFWKWKFIKDLVINLLILGTIILLSMNKIIEGSIVGTLLGSVIGYSIGKGFSKNQKD